MLVRPSPRAAAAWESAQTRVAAGSTAATANAARELRADTSGSRQASRRWATMSASNSHLPLGRASGSAGTGRSLLRGYPAERRADRGAYLSGTDTRSGFA